MLENFRANVLKREKVAINTTLRAEYGSIYQRDTPDFVFVSEFR